MLKSHLEGFSEVERLAVQKREGKINAERGKKMEPKA